MTTAARPLPPATVFVRATDRHAAALAQLAEATFVDTFGPLYKPENLAAHVKIAYSNERMLQEIANEQVVLLCRETDPDATAPLGFFQIREHRNDLLKTLTEEYVDPCWEVHRLYLVKEAQGMKLGARLILHMLSMLKQAGAKSAWLSVYSENFRAQRFYEKFGFGHSGHTMEYVVGDQIDIEFCYTIKF
ncbi:acyl-CoA N-acyltransferase [Chytriomyces sp. MP71]|nr:acyl-CoA N-acyltransferase [Chytriomyces sp. MP71]